MAVARTRSDSSVGSATPRAHVRLRASEAEADTGDGGGGAADGEGSFNNGSRNENCAKCCRQGTLAIRKWLSGLWKDNRI